MAAFTPTPNITQLTLELTGASRDATPAPKRPKARPQLPAYPSPEVRINWFGVFADLKRAAWSMYRIESQLRIPKTTLLGWKEGAEPKHFDGERLIQLWCDVTGKKREQLPVERRLPSAYQARR